MFDLISIVVTGRNDADHLDTLLRRLRLIDVTHEVIYVDLDSQDDSLRIARRYTDKVFLVQDMVWRRTSGRWVGATVAEFDWILFIDADMSIQEEFIDFLNNRTYMHAKGKIGGYVGTYHRLDGEKRDPTNILPNRPGTKIARFEGALLVKTEPLLRSGNWIPSINAHAHLDLRARLVAAGCYIESVPIPMVILLKPERSNVLRTVEELLPLNRNFFGLGQVLASQVVHRTLFHFIALHPWPFLLGISLLIWLMTGELWGLILFGLLVVVLLIYRDSRYVVDCLLSWIRAPFGLFAYRTKKPNFKQV